MEFQQHFLQKAAQTEPIGFKRVIDTAHYQSPNSDDD